MIKDYQYLQEVKYDLIQNFCSKDFIFSIFYFILFYEELFYEQIYKNQKNFGSFGLQFYVIFRGT